MEPFASATDPNTMSTSLVATFLPRNVISPTLVCHLPGMGIRSARFTMRKEDYLAQK